MPHQYYQKHYSPKLTYEAKKVFGGIVHKVYMLVWVSPNGNTDHDFTGKTYSTKEGLEFTRPILIEFTNGKVVYFGDEMTNVVVNPCKLTDFKDYKPED